MKRLKMFYVVMFVCLFALCGCGNSENAELQKQMEELQKENEELNVKLDEMNKTPTPTLTPTVTPTPTATPKPIFVLSEYYQIADDYDKIYPLLISYFTCVQNVYDESDKIHLNSFILAEEYKDISKQLQELSDSSEFNLSEAYRAKLMLIIPFTEVERHIKGKDLIEAYYDFSDIGNEEWFVELSDMLTGIYYEYETYSKDTE